MAKLPDKSRDNYISRRGAQYLSFPLNGLRCKTRPRDKIIELYVARDPCSSRVPRGWQVASSKRNSRTCLRNSSRRFARRRRRGLSTSRALQINELHESDAIHDPVTRLDWIIWEHMGRWNAITSAREAAEETFEERRKKKGKKREKAIKADCERASSRAIYYRALCACMRDVVNARTGSHLNFVAATGPL